MKKPERPKRPSRLDAIAASAELDYKHLSTQDITRRTIILYAEVNARDSELHELSARLAEAKDQRAKLEAALAGLASVLAKR